ncbi:putative transposase [Candidatus Erwinia dacicola]|uniref:Transposase n=1 Tax=Candidatus Erwinia dacicola TaxID=252393 RepID=A0A328TRG2_9GAMM|nr:putative transposase [Candidatus Erwinia dacicola]
MLPRFVDIFQQGNRWLNWYHRQPEGSVRPVVIEAQKSWPAAPRLWGTPAGAVLTPDVVIQKSLLPL